MPASALTRHPGARPGWPEPQPRQYCRMVHTPAWIELDGVVNMRDVGGLPTVDGRVITPGRLIRSDNLQDLPLRSVRRLVEELGVTDVVDLRTHVEVAKEGEGPLRARPEVHHHHFTLYPEQSHETGLPPGERELPWAGDTRATLTRPDHDEHPQVDHDAYWSNYYLGYLAQRPDSVVAALRAIARSRGAAVVHCAAGKDRTGTIVGLALKVAGVDDDTITADFVASGERITQILTRLSGRASYAVEVTEALVAQQSPRTDTMRLLLAALHTRFGGLDAWLDRQGWRPDDTDRLRSKLLD